MKSAGGLKVKVTEGESPVANKDVYLVSNSGILTGSYKATAIDQKKTDENGLVDFGEISDGYYSIIVDDITINGMEYFPIRPVQIVGGVNKEYEVNVQEYTGNIELKIIDEGVPVSGCKIAIVPEVDYNYDISFERNLERAVKEYTADMKGKKSIDIPSGISYRILMYEKSLLQIEKTKTLRVLLSKGDEIKVDVELYRNYNN